MQIAVILREMPDSALPVRLESGRVAREALPTLINPLDEAALAAAVQLSSSVAGSEVRACLVARPGSLALAHRCFALGAQTVRLIELDEALGLDPATCAAHLMPELGASSLVLIGRETPGDALADTGALLSGRLDIALITDACSIELSPEAVRVVRDLGSGSCETLIAPLPALVTTELAIATPRYLTLMALAAARKKQPERPEPASFEAALPESRGFRELPPRAPCVMLQSVDELVERIRLSLKEAA